jgi:hypothetical protein
MNNVILKPYPPTSRRPSPLLTGIAMRKKIFKFNPEKCSVKDRVSFDNWVYRTENIFELSNINDEETKMRTVSLLLEGDVLRWWREVSQTHDKRCMIPDNTFAEFKEAVIARYKLK